MDDRPGALGGAVARKVLAGWLVWGLAAALAAGVASAAAGPPAGWRLAYLDPGAGSFILQALVAAIAGVIVAIHAYWTKIRRLLGLPRGEKEDGAAPTQPSDD